MNIMAVERCGGHSTLVFSIWKDSHLARSQGSRGAGLNIADGVEANVEFVSSNKPDSKGSYLLVLGWIRRLAPQRMEIFPIEVSWNGRS